MIEGKKRFVSLVVKLFLLVAILIYGFSIFYYRRAPHRILDETIGRDNAVMAQRRAINVLNADFQAARSQFGEPDRRISIRKEEELLIWNWRVVTLQLHLHRDRILRMAFFSDERLVREAIFETVLSTFEPGSRWKDTVKTIEDESQKVMISQSGLVTAFITRKAVMIYGYELPD